MLAALVSFIAAQTANHQLWQRYVEPMLLIWLALAAAHAIDLRPALRPLRLAGPVILAIGFAALTALSIVQGKPFPVELYDRTVLPAIERHDDGATREALERVREVLQGPQPP